MHLVIHDASLRKVAFVDNTKQNTLKYIKYEWYRSLETAGSTFTVTIKKMAIQTDNHYEVAYNHLNERSFITFKKKNKTHLFSVMVVTEDEETITCTCESANLELINEYANPYKASKPMTFVEYCNAMGLLSFTYLTIGLNEVSDKSLTLELESQETKLARLLSLANKFDAEIEFDTRLNADSSIKQFILNVYHENDDTHQGVGRIREDVRLVYGKNIKSVTRTIDKTNVVNAIRPTGTKDGNTVVISGLSAWEEKNEDGVVEFYQKGEMLHAPISMQMYPSTFTHSTIDDQWTRKDITVDSDNPTVIRAEGIKALKRLAYPSITYEVDGFIDADIGDTVKVIDNGFVPKLILKARVIEQYIYDDETRNKAVLGNFTALKSRISDGIQAAFERLFEASKPYLIKLSTDNGVIFKNQIGQSIITPSLYKGGKPVTTNVTWRWALDGNVTTGMTYTVRGADVTDTATLTVAAYVGNDEVAVDEISFANVLDGAQGTPGRDGVDGIPGRDGVGIAATDITYYLSTSGTITPTSGWTSSVPELIKGRYLWTRIIWTYTDGQRETGYQVTYIGQDGNTGRDGLPGKDGVGITSTIISYARSPSGTSAPTSGWTSQVPSVPPGEFLWTKTVWNYSDSTSETGYSVAKMGADGTGLLTTWTFYTLSNSTSAPQVVPIGASTNLSHLGPNNTWTPFKELSGRASGWNTIDFDKIAKSSIIPDRPFTWYLVASFDGVSNFNGSTDFNIRFENWYVNSSGAAVYNSLGIRDFIASNFSATNDTTVNNYFSQSITWTVPREVYDAIPEGGFLNLRIRIDRFTKLSYHAKNSYVTYGTVPSDFTQRGLGNYSTYGWKASPEAVTQALPYLWIYQIQFYDNGREVAIPPTLIGTQGADGRTSYIHWAYSDNADGTGLTSSDNGQRYIGHYSDYMQEDSTDKTKYRWADRWAKIEAGNGNLLRWTTVSSENLKYFIKSDSATLSIEHKEGKNAYKIAIANSVPNTDNGAFFNSNENPDGQGPTFNLYPNCRYTFTFSVWSSVSIPFNYNSLGYHQVIGRQNVSGGIRHQHRDASWSVSSIKQGEWQRVSYSFTAISLSYFHPFFWYLPYGIEIYLADMMLSDGNIELPWEPSHLDLVNSIETKADKALTQQQLNLLTEKAQQMQTELEAKVAMETLSDLERAYKAYVEANDKEVAKSQADLIEAGRRVDAMVETLGGLSKTKTFIETYIKEAEEGIIIGTKDNVSQIRITYDRIAMYSAGKEVMYISQGVIHIDNGVFTKSLQIGRFRTEQHQTNLDINVCRYVG